MLIQLRHVFQGGLDHVKCQSEESEQLKRIEKRAVEEYPLPMGTGFKLRGGL